MPLTPPTPPHHKASPSYPQGSHQIDKITWHDRTAFYRPPSSYFFEKQDFEKHVAQTLDVCARCPPEVWFLKTRKPTLFPETLTHELFHEECKSCLEFAKDSQEDSLCHFCRHLRVRHLSKCVSIPFVVSLIFPPLQDLEKNLGCVFCRLVFEAGTKQELDKRISPTVQLLSNEVRRLSKDAYGDHKDYSLVVKEPWFQAFPCDYQYLRVSIYAQDAPSSPHDSIAVAEELDRGEASRLSGPVWRTMKRHMERCFSSHEECHGTYAKSPPTDFRVIDVHLRRIVKAPPQFRFVALSYVWGPDCNPQWLQGTCESITDLERIGSLEATRLPNTINDAIEACRNLGEDYLWVDRLCIIQDDEEHKQHQLDGMAAIFSSARFVLVAADGDSMACGLAGMSRPRQKRRSEMISGLEFTYTPLDKSGTVDHSAWIKRAWTFQEAILSKRKLYFTSTQLCYECECGVEHEHYMNHWMFKHNAQLGGHFNALRLKSNPGLARIGTYSGCIRRYTRRSLSKDSDLLNAFLGILDALYGIENTTFGLPRPDLDQALLWHHEYMPNLYEDPQPLFHNGSLKVPTWSWPSMKGPLIGSLDPSRTFCGTLVQWFEGSEQGLLRIDTSCSSAFEECDTSSPISKKMRRVYAAIAWTEGCFESESSFPALRRTSASNIYEDLPQRIPEDEGYFDGHLNPGGWKWQVPTIPTSSFSAFDAHLCQRWPCYKDFWKEAFSPDVSWAADLDCHNQPGRLFTRAQAAFFRLEPGAQVVRIVDTEGKLVGFLDGVGFCIQAFSDSTVEFVALSVCSRIEAITFSPNPEIPLLSPNIPMPEISYVDASGSFLSPFPVVSVMMIERNGPLARRIHVGWIYLRKWVEAKPVFKTLILE